MTRHLITSAIPYVGPKHLGNIAGSLLPADVHARFRRQTGHEVLYVCGTDEHGTPAELAAAAAGEDVAAYCARQHELQRRIYASWGFSFDHFGRSSSARNRELTPHFYRRLDAAGLIEERTVPQIWSPADGRYLPDRYVLGTCPHCGFAAARGDQCDGCGTLLDPVDLVSPRSAISGSTALEVRGSRHLFLRQTLLRERLRDWVGSRRGWPYWVVSQARGLLTVDLRDRCITRDLAWGVPVPRPGFEGKVFYVWFDAPIAYIASTQAWADLDPDARDWRDWWLDPDTRYTQFLGKDNVAFHAVGFPATLLGSDEPWKTADVIKGFHWLSYQGGKFSTSQGRGIFADQALEELPADLWRWWLAANAPETSDVDFEIGRFAADANKDLADVFGNLVNRVLGFAERAFGGAVPEGGEPGVRERRLAADAAALVAEARAAHEELEFRKAAAATRAVWAAANAYFQDAAPWSELRTDRAAAACSTRVALGLVRLGAVLAWSFIPQLAGRVLEAFGEDGAHPPWPGDVEQLLLSGTSVPFVRPAHLVRKIDADTAARLEGRFGGGRPAG